MALSPSIAAPEICTGWLDGRYNWVRKYAIVRARPSSSGAVFCRHCEKVRSMAPSSVIWPDRRAVRDNNWADAL